MLGIQPVRLWRLGVMRVRGPNNAGRAVQTDPTLLRHALVITEQKKCCDLFAQNFDRFQILHKNSQQHATTCSRVCKRTQHVTSNNVGSCWPTKLGPFSRSEGQEHSWLPIVYLFIYVLSILWVRQRHLSMYCFTLLSSPSFVWLYKLSSVLDPDLEIKGGGGYPYPEIRRRGRSTNFLV